jgi:hypothetical protein
MIANVKPCRWDFLCASAFGPWLLWQLTLDGRISWHGNSKTEIKPHILNKKQGFFTGSPTWKQMEAITAKR